MVKFCYFLIFFIFVLQPRLYEACDPALCSNGCCQNSSSCSGVYELGLNNAILYGCISIDCSRTSCGNGFCCVNQTCFASSEAACATTTTSSSGGSSRSSTFRIVGIIILVLVILCIIGCCVYCIRRRMKRKLALRKEEEANHNTKKVKQQKSNPAQYQESGMVLNSDQYGQPQQFYGGGGSALNALN